MCPRWAAAGECDKNVAFMRSNCPGACVDVASADNCAVWEAAGECTRNPFFMHKRCKRTCGVAALPRGKLTSEKGGAAAQAARRRLQAEASGRTGGGTAAAAQSSGLGCDDKDQRCPMWARADECNRNPEFMHKRCARSCNMCRVRLSASRRADSEL
ncbi:hypothetical protein EMIHUDRAFT_200728 [Emiliania huxleyi CCMP1516]|uniref:ShKT domain-containing protein n=2 Tax=Emiliania huxleyi TaxID=2903 RepID=A0A0D3KR17_EMIH1|nr:hypothetical protein EMIHUDRAFT_200728 [Emiliania huxleyi CCMP1516]EOD38202.1 hypothetical protein EMIHUDRAFT_200728 [Emiliania huxleyi CCMP1516]|eukprot:XP_005790631.1 hypothetical protein EMIHUDRAFT_200728 [Emiliania huxleyi CCMP1516]